MAPSFDDGVSTGNRALTGFAQEARLPYPRLAREDENGWTATAQVLVNERKLCGPPHDVGGRVDGRFAGRQATLERIFAGYDRAARSQPFSTSAHDVAVEAIERRQAGGSLQGRAVARREAKRLHQQEQCLSAWSVVHAAFERADSLAAQLCAGG
jgi:hypothetical protein